MDITKITGRVSLIVAIVAAVTVWGTALNAEGAKPTRTVTVPGQALIPPGEGCSFAVKAEANEDARVAVTAFTDGRVVTHDIANPTFTNLDTGKTLVHRSRFMFVEHPSSVEGQVAFESSGQWFMTLLPGDQGPNGLVEYPGLLLSINGHVRITMDTSTFVYTSFSLNGTATDLCAALGS